MMRAPMTQDDFKSLVSGDHGEPTMSSREISELVDSRHDKVKQSIERLAERGIIVIPPTGEYLDSVGRGGQFEYPRYSKIRFVCNNQIVEWNLSK
jgi:phage regulator Rha-like protein